jgi:murein DD-endopeptidase MepM/ murein hydrolase activator NlpD
LKFHFAVGLITLLLGACGQADSKAQDVDLPERIAPKPVAQEIISSAVAQIPALQKPNMIECTGVLAQGGAVLCQTWANAKVTIDGVTTQADDQGRVIIGFDRDEKPDVTLNVVSGDGVTAQLALKIAPREYNVQRIDGLPPSQVSNYSKAQIARIRSSSARKKQGFASREQTMWLKDGFNYPLKDFVKTSPFGAQRILNGEPKSPHYGVDIAAPVGTPIYAPADGTVSLADDDLYFEGAMVLLDHGQGLISMYLHMSAIDVKPGQVVKRGEKLGEVGARGRATGPHLCWRLKWRNRHLDPELLTTWPNEE